MKKFFQNLSGKQKLFAFIFFVSVISILLAFFTYKIEYSFLLSAVIIIVMLITKSIWLPEDYGKTFIRRASLLVAITASLTYGSWPNFKIELFKKLIQTYFPQINLDYNIISGAPPALIFAFLLSVIWIVNYNTRDKTAMGKHRDPIDKDIPEPAFKDRLEMVCSALYDDLKSIDIKTNWSSQLFTPLDAEVEIRTKNGISKKVDDLLKSIRSIPPSKERVFLVLGDPGSGKSVALRKLCQDLLKEVDKTGKIPVYINLKEWSTQERWNDASSIDIKQLEDFVLSNLKNRDIVTSKFFDKYFYKLYKTGRLYFVLDSFDEIPSVLNEKDNSELIKKLSEVIFKFLKGGRAKESQGILSSRFFRKPTQEFQTNTIIEIRPFTEEKIRTTFKRYASYDDRILKELFKERAELVPTARNPFTAGLIAEYIESKQHLPSNQADMYENYISSTLKSCKERLEKKNLNKDKVIEYTIEIAHKMFERYGLEAPVNRLRQILPDIPIDEVIDILKFAKIGRSGTGDDNLFGFVHRRFCEYFAVQKLILGDDNFNNELDLAKDSIPVDSRWRDALVLYCEVAKGDKASEIAVFCWKTIKDIDNPQDLRVIHCMRFLRDAFRGRLECIKSFRKEFAEYIHKQINKESNIISVKLAVECLGLLEEADVDKSVVKAMELNNSWINETVIKACRHLSRISSELEKKLIIYLNKMGSFSIFKERKELSFSLSLSECFGTVRSFFKWKLFDFYWLLTGIVLSFFVYFPLFVGWQHFLIFLLAFLFLLLLIRYLYYLEFIDSLIRIYRSLFLFSIISAFLVSSKDLFNNNELLLLITIIGKPLTMTLSAMLLLTLNILLIIPLYKVKFFITLYSSFFHYLFSKKEIIKNIIFAIRILAINVIIFIPIILIGLLLTFFHVPSYLVLSIFFLNVLISIILSGIYLRKEIYLVYSFYKSITLKQCNDRGYIYSCLQQLKRSNFFKSKFILYLENNIKEVKGEWPDPNFLNVSSDPYITRLAKLEEKWLGLDR